LTEETAGLIGAEQLADEARRGPVDQADGAAGAADADELVGGELDEVGGPAYLAQLTGSGAAIIGARDFACPSHTAVVSRGLRVRVPTM
jgi:hypothetical protein